MNFPDFPPEMVSTRLELATNFLTVLNTIDPGLSKFRAKFMYEVIDTRIYLFSRRFQETGEANIKELQGKNITFPFIQVTYYVFTEFVELLDEVLNIFNILGTSSPFEKMIHAKSNYLRKSCKEMSTLGFLK